MTLSSEMQGAERAERAEKTATEQAIKLKAAREAREKKQVKKRKSHRSIVSRLGKIADPLQAIHDTAEHALAADDHETAVVVASNLAMLCLKMLEDCLNDLGDVERVIATHGLLARCSKQREGSAPGAAHKPRFGGAFLFGNNHVYFVAAIYPSGYFTHRLFYRAHRFPSI